MHNPPKRDSALILLSLIFFIWGAITVISNSLIPHYKDIFNLDYQTATLFLMAFFISRIIVSLPISLVMIRIGYKSTLIYCLLWCLFGSITMVFCVSTEELIPTLIGIFIMASGISAIQVVTAPYISLLSTPEHSIRRQGIAAASNSIGTVLGPIALSFIIVVTDWFGIVKMGLQISTVFICVALFFFALIIYFRTIDLPDIHSDIRKGFWKGFATLLKNIEFTKLALVLLLYIGVEVSFGTFTIVYLADEDFGNLGLVSATQLIAIYWALMFLGRFIFAGYGYRLDSSRLLVILCAFSVLICLIALQTTHRYVGYLMILVGLFNAPLYAIIYARTLKVAKDFSSQAAALLTMCTIGGAILPLFQAMTIDSFGLSASYLVPAVGYILMIILFTTGLKTKLYSGR